MNRGRLLYARAKAMVYGALLHTHDWRAQRARDAARPPTAGAEPASSPSRIMVCGVSRSGTTLLCAILDSHPAVAMGYEMLPANLPPAAELIEMLRATDGSAQALDELGNRMRQDGRREFGMFLKRCLRCTLSAEDLAGVLVRLRGEGIEQFAGFDQRVRLSDAVVAVKQQRQAAPVGGYKLSGASLERFHRLHPDARLVLIVRDPRDVLASHIVRRFKRTPEAVLGSWLRLVTAFEDFRASHPGLCALVRYEDLVSQPEPTLRAMCTAIGLPYHAGMLAFHRSKASVLAGGHVNSAQLRKGFVDTSRGRWRLTLDDAHVALTRKACARAMRRHGYDPGTPAELQRISASLVRRKRATFAHRRRYQMHQYGPLVEMMGRGARNLTLAQMARGNGKPDDTIFVVRHDIDHDLENAVRIAAWEKARGVRATYCVLHSAWYYGSGERRYTWALDACREIQDLGHEINLHNNFACEALRRRQDPFRMLAEELEFLRANGLEVVGTSSHGDSLCGSAGLFNFELFSECVYASKGGPRRVEHAGHAIELGSRSMSEFGLLYEAYDFPRDVYVTESGGRLRERRGTRGRGGLYRASLDVRYQKIIGLTTHPEWWGWDEPPRGAQPAPPPFEPAAPR
jgi:hypothetical protein